MTSLGDGYCLARNHATAGRLKSSKLFAAADDDYDDDDDDYNVSCDEKTVC